MSLPPPKNMRPSKPVAGSMAGDEDRAEAHLSCPGEQESFASLNFWSICGDLFARECERSTVSLLSLVTWHLAVRPER